MCCHGVEGEQGIVDGVEAREGVTEEDNRLIWIAFFGMYQGSVDTSEFRPDNCVCLTVPPRFHQVGTVIFAVVEGCS